MNHLARVRHRESTTVPLLTPTLFFSVLLVTFSSFAPAPPETQTPVLRKVTHFSHMVPVWPLITTQNPQHLSLSAQTDCTLQKGGVDRCLLRDSLT